MHFSSSVIRWNLLHIQGLLGVTIENIQVYAPDVGMHGFKNYLIPYRGVERLFVSWKLELILLIICAPSF